MKHGYVLRSRDETEIGRLHVQHEVWRQQTEQILAPAGFGPGDHVADLGCGPGYLTVDLARMVGREGSVRAIDGSESFIAHLVEASKEPALRHVRPERASIEEVELGHRCLDGVVCRWVLMFLSSPRDVIEKAVRALKPGGRFVAMEYFEFRSMSIHPGASSYDRVYDALYEHIVSHGGDPDVGSALPAMLEEAGCDLVSVESILRVGRPGSDLWQWLEATSRNYADLVEAGLLTESDVEQYHRDWQERAGTPGAFFTPPPVLGVVARKRLD